MRPFILALVLFGSAVVAPCRTSAAPPDDEFAAAAAHYAAGRWDEASNGFEAFLRSHPDHPRAVQARFYCGESFAQQGRYAEARRQFAELERSSPQSRYARQAQFRSAESAYLGGDMPAARRELQAFIDRYGGDDLCVYALEHLGSLELQDGNPSAARQWFATAVERFRDSPLADECRLGLAESAYAMGDMQEAAGAFSALTTAGKSKELIARGHSGLGWSRYKSEDWSGAADAFGRLLQDCPDSALAVESALMRASSLEHLDKFDEALASYKDALARHPKAQQHAEAVWGAARMHDQLKQPAEAVEDYSRLVGDHPDFPELDAALYRWARLLHERGQTADAAELWARLRRDFPRSALAADAAIRMAEAAMAEGKLADAGRLLADIDHSLLGDSVKQHALFLKARVAMGSGQWSEAETRLQDLLKQSPDGELALSAKYWLAEAAYRQGHFEDAVRIFNELASQPASTEQPWSAAAELRRAQALAQLKQWNDALEVAQAIPSKWPKFAEQYEVDYLIGRALVANAEFEAAREAYLRVLASPAGAGTETGAMARFMIGESYFHQENYQAALAEYERAQSDSKFPRWRSAALMQSGKCQEALGDWQAAIAAYEKLASVDPDGPLTADARRRAAAAREQASAKRAKTKLK